MCRSSNKNVNKNYESIRRAGICACLSYFFLVLLIYIILVLGCGKSENIILKDSFNESELDASIWKITVSGDFSDKRVDIYDKDPSVKKDMRLRIKAGTISTTSPVKTLGVMCHEIIDFTDGITIEGELDWNSQRNGSYLSAVIMLSPEVLENMDKMADLIALEYSGVPPGKNIKVVMSKKIRRSLKVLYKDSGPSDALGRGAGRDPGNESIFFRIYIDKENIQFSENKTDKISLSPHALNFTSGYFYIQMRSGTNYPDREIYFDNVRIYRGKS